MHQAAQTNHSKYSRELRTFLEATGVAQPAQTTRELIEYDNRTQRLIGSSTDATLVFYFNTESNAIIRLGLDDQFQTKQGLIIGIVKESKRVRTWVQKYAVNLGWVHPRYR